MPDRIYAGRLAGALREKKKSGDYEKSNNMGMRFFVSGVLVE
jgi:hypothetical protein